MGKEILKELVSLPDLIEFRRAMNMQPSSEQGINASIRSVKEGKKTWAELGYEVEKKDDKPFVFFLDKEMESKYREYRSKIDAVIDSII
jgi:hypothetical protein